MKTKCLQNMKLLKVKDFGNFAENPQETASLCRRSSRKQLIFVKNL